MLLNKDRANQVYVSGPMTGLPNLNFPAFNALAYKFRQEGWKVLNPAEQEQVHGAKWSDYLRSDIAFLAICDAIVLLPGWSKSKGASLEAHIAKELGMELILSDGAEEYIPGLIEYAGEHVECHLEKQIDILRIDLESSKGREAALREELIEKEKTWTARFELICEGAIRPIVLERNEAQQRLTVAEQLLREAQTAFNYNPEGSCYNPGISFVKPWSIKVISALKPAAEGEGS